MFAKYKELIGSIVLFLAERGFDLLGFENVWMGGTLPIFIQNFAVLRCHPTTPNIQLR